MNRIKNPARQRRTSDCLSHGVRNTRITQSDTASGTGSANFVHDVNPSNLMGIYSSRLPEINNDDIRLRPLALPVPHRVTTE
jgi:hypothetical protein